MVRLQQQIRLLLLNKVFITLLIGFGFYTSKSQNLISNSSFEFFLGTNCNGSGFSINNWNNIASPDYYHINCNPVNYGIPTNRFGCIPSVSGNAYVGIASYYKTAEVKEYIYQHLGSPLITGNSYYVSFYVSRADRIGYSIKNIGANFSVSQPSVASSNTWIPANPQVKNLSGYLTDTIGWTKIEGYFTAQGGEEYITIGNFNSNANTDTLYSGTTNTLPSDPGMSYYYIDSVSLYDSINIPMGFNEKSKEERFNLYPNPNVGNFNLEYAIKQESELLITDITGREIKSYALLPSQSKLSINEELSAGVYFYSIKYGSQITKQNKIIVVK